MPLLQMSRGSLKLMSITWLFQRQEDNGCLGLFLPTQSLFQPNFMAIVMLSKILNCQALVLSGPLVLF